jgi:hypothetical protein
MKKLIALASLLLLPPLADAASVAVRLIHATNTPAAVKDSELQSSLARLEKAFGWREYRVLSRSGASLKQDEIRQLDLGQNLALRLKLLSVAGKVYQLRCELLRGEQSIVQTTANIASGSSYFITGPSHDNGQLLISVAVR